ncbi:chemosensory pili system protein ChpA (sensor histidine kinase/response regulator) [Polaromonas sp. CG_9.5]|uniref:hybrid sensor histidine kinase/response regulator n=1 Tax=Polaromonas sp. CG_9.5 TaxID=3071705 RepID=UPI002E02F96B|nr:chemosensory pili system protein ChpA (sensor histidine kinase/response regulator) [Polaromonas sp. CG_9.5]
MHSMVTNSIAAEPDASVSDLSPLAWVLDELRKSLEGASKALKRFAWDAEMARGSDLAAIETSQLRIARQQLHQAVGVLEMVGLASPALLLRAMESAAQKFLQHPELCTQDAVAKIEYASFALTEYLECVLADKPVSAVSLFPQYRDVQELVRAERIHPADLWPFEWRWLEPQLSVLSDARPYDDEARSTLDQSVLQLMKGQNSQAARSLRDLSLGFAANQTEHQVRIFWLVVAGYFEAVAHNLLGSDLYVRRAASRILIQYASLSKGDTSVSERLALDLLFFCAQAVSNRASDTPVLSAVRFAYGLTQFKPVNYELLQFGRFDPALLAQARKRIVSAKEAWSSLCAGEITKMKLVSDQFSLVTDSLRKLHAPSEPLAVALTGAVESTVRSGQTPGIQLAMEVATSVLYLEAVFQDLDPSDPQLAVRTASLAERLEWVINGGEPQSLEGWMEELYSRVSDKQTMGSVVSELRVSLGDLEKSLDLFFRNPQDKTSLQLVPAQLSQMRGVLSVLGLDQAAKAILHMRGRVEQMLETEIDEKSAQVTGVFEHLGNNLGALSFLIDMLNYQPVLAKKLFVYDEDKDELKPLMGRSQGALDAASSVTVNNESLSSEAAAVVNQTEGLVTDDIFFDSLDKEPELLSVPADQFLLAPPQEEVTAAVESLHVASDDAPVAQTIPVAAPVAQLPVSLPTPLEFEEDDLQDIFLEEAREVIVNALQAIEALAKDPADSEQLTVLRRAFHTLKGSARMVGLNEFGEAAWSMEQMLNSWLADQKTAIKEFRNLCSEVINAFERWVADIAAAKDSPWSAAPFRRSAEAMHIEGRYRALDLSGEVSDPLLSSSVADVAAADSKGSLEALQADAGIQPAMAPEITPAVPEIVDTVELTDADFDQYFLADAASPELAETTAIEAIELPNDLVASEVATDLPLSTVMSDKADQAEPIPLEIENDIPELKVDEQDQVLASLDGVPVSEVSQEENADSGIKIIDGLRIGIPLYNVYLNEADEWSRRLVSEVAEWALESDQPISASTVALAHSLTGSSATVGFMSLSELARSLENALGNSRTHHNHGASAYGQLFVDASEDIRRLLHQFAAGFLKQPQQDILDRLKQLEFSGSDSPQTYDDDAFELFDDLAPASEDRTEPATDVPHETAVDPVASVKDESEIEVVTAPQAVAKQVVPIAVSVDDAAFAFDDDDIDAVDTIDLDLFPIFEEECAELMPRLGAALRQWSDSPDDQSARQEVLRVLHTLKGSARLAGAMRLGEMAHHIESEISYVGSDAAASQEFEPLLNRFDRMQSTFEVLRQADVAAVQAPLADVVAAPVIANEQKQHADKLGTSKEKAGISGMSSDRSDSIGKIAIPAPQTLAMQPLRQATNASIRVRTQLLDRMVNQAGEVMITRSRLESEIGELRLSLNDMTSNLTRLRQQLRDIELQTETQMQSRLALAKEAQTGFDPLEFDRFTRAQELTRMMAESVNDVATVQRTLQRTIEATEDDLIIQGRQTRELQRDLLRTRMVEFDSVSERLYRVVRQASKETGKQVRMDLQGGNLEMDRGMLDRMLPAFEHLLRNCVTHGIEEPQVRADAGKDPVGLITVQLRQEVSDISVDFSDDGAGLDLARIRAQGIRLGLMTPDQSVDDQAIADLIFVPGFSTADTVTELAGRGVGMDVVRTDVMALGGRIRTASVAGKSTHFTLVLPLTTAVTQVVMIRSGNLSVGVPVSVVETVRRSSAAELAQAYRTGTLDVGGEAVPFFWSGALLQSSHNSSEVQGKTSPVIIFRSADQRIALHVDEVLGNREVVVKNLGPQLARLPGLTGMSVLPSGAVALIYNPVALAAVYGEQARAWSLKYADSKAAGASDGDILNIDLPSAAQKAPLVMVVDDSITVRRVTQRMLLRDGYRVVMAADGLQALERLQEEIPSVVLSDIEMPRMDGFDLVRNIRADARMKDLPIIMITSRIAEKHREHAMKLGINHYLGKPYSEEELLRLVGQYCAQKAVAVA